MKNKLLGGGRLARLGRITSLEHAAVAAAHKCGRPAAARKCFTAFCRKFRLRERSARFVKAGGGADAPLSGRFV